MALKPFTGRVGSWIHWTTPAHFIARVRRIGPTGVDPASNLSSCVAARFNFLLFDEGETPDGFVVQDGLAANWNEWILKAGGGLVYVNPPYSPMQPWVDKLCAEADNGVEILALIASKTDTNWWHQLVGHGDAGCFWRGRISFSNAPPTGKPHVPSPSVASFVWYTGPNADKFIDVFEDAGEIVRLRTKRP